MMTICRKMSQKKEPPEQLQESKIKKTGYEFCRTTSAHGYSHLIYERSYKLKFFWLAITIIAFAMNGFHISELVRQYLRFPSEEVSRVVYSVLQFPSVTICNIQPESLSQRELLLQNATSKYKYWENITDSYFADLLKSRNLSEELEHLYNRLKQPVGFYENIGDEVDFIGHKNQDFILQCTFNGHHCTTDDFKEFKDPHFYNCYTFNSGKVESEVKKSRNTGPQDGLSLILYLESDNGDENSEGTYHTFSNIGNSVGVRIDIEPPNTQPNPADNGFDISPGFSTSVSINVERKIRLDDPYGACHKDNRSGNSHIYSSQECITNCKQQYILEKCGCISIMDFIPFETPEDKSRYCGYYNPEKEEDFFTHVQCEYQYTEEFSQDDLLLNLCKCDPPCIETFYQKSMSFSYWPLDFVQRPFYEHYVLNHPLGQTLKAYRNLSKYNWSDLVKAGMIRKNFARVNIYFSELAINEFVQKKSYELHNLWSDIGGTFGLWIGFSVITWCEFIQLAIRMIVYKVQVNKEKRNAEKTARQNSHASSTQLNILPNDISFNTLSGTDNASINKVP